MVKLTRRTFAGGVAAGTVGVLAMPALLRAQEGPIKIGCLTSLSGSQEIYGMEVRIGAEIAVDQINASGGVGGRQLELILRDDKGTASDAVFGARELSGEGVTFFVGGLYTPVALGLSALMPEINGVFFSTGSLSTSLTHENFNRHYFRLNDNSFLRCNAQAKIVSQRFPEVRKWRGMLSDSATGRDAWESFQYGMLKHFPDAELAEPVFFKSGSPDMKAQISQLMSTPMDGLYTAGFSGADIITYVQQSDPFGLRDHIKMYMDYGAELAFGQAVGHRMLPNFWTGSNWYPDSYADNSISVALTTEYIARTGRPQPQSFVGLTHANINAIAQGIQAAGSSHTEEVIAALEGATVSTCRGDILIRPEDHQGLGDVNVIRLDPTTEDPGFAVTDYVREPGKDVVEPPSPGVAFSLESMN